MLNLKAMAICPVRLEGLWADDRKNRFSGGW